MNTPKLRFKEFSGEWMKHSLEELSYDVYYGLNAAAKQFDGVNKYLRITDINEESGQFQPSPLTSPDINIFEEKYLLKKNDICFARTGASVGKSYWYSEEDGKLFYAGFLIKFSIKENCDSYFVNLQTKRTAYWKWVKMVSMRSGQPGINAEEYKSYTFKLPSLPEQQKIASFFTAVDQKLTALKKKKELLEQYKKGVMQQIFSQKLRFKDDTGNPFPEWEERKLGEICNVVMGQSPDSKFYNTEEVGIPLIQGNADIQNRKTFPRSWTSQKTKECLKGDLILTVRAPVGAVAKSFHNACIGRGVCAIISNEDNVQDYIFQFLIYYETQWKKLEQGSTFTAVSGNEIKNLHCPRPSTKEQQKIADFLSAIDNKINAVAQQIEKTEQWKKGLLQQMFV